MGWAFLTACAASPSEVSPADHPPALPPPPPSLSAPRIGICGVHRARGQLTAVILPSCPHTASETPRHVGRNLSGSQRVCRENLETYNKPPKLQSGSLSYKLSCPHSWVTRMRIEMSCWAGCTTQGGLRGGRQEWLGGNF